MHTLENKLDTSALDTSAVFQLLLLPVFAFFSLLRLSVTQRCSSSCSHFSK